MRTGVLFLFGDKGNELRGAPVGHSPKGENEASESIETSSSLQRQQGLLRRLRLR